MTCPNGRKDKFGTTMNRTQTQTQREKVLEYLTTHPEGLNSFDATYKLGLGKQTPSRIKELREAGYKIRSIQKRNRSVNWVLGSDSALRIQSPSLEDQYDFLPSGIAVLKVAPRQESLL